MKTKDVLFIYIRVSTTEQEEKDLSMPRQKELGIKLATELGMSYKVFAEAGESASQENFDNRPQLFEILCLVKEGTVKHLFVFDQTRLSRNSVTKSVICESLKKQKVNLYTHSKRFDFNKEEDVLTFRILQDIETYETALRKARFKLGYVSANKKGRYLKGIPPYGYKKDNEGFLIIDEEEKEVFLNIVDLYLNKGFGTNQIANWLNENSIPTKTSKVLKHGYTLKRGVSNRRMDVHKSNNEWNPGTIMSMLKSELYCGKRRFKIGEDDFEYVDCPPIINKVTFDKIQILRVNNGITKKKEDKYFYLLKDLVSCGNCGQPFHGRVKPDRGEYLYKCNSKRQPNSTCNGRGINLTKLNNIVWNAFKSSIFYHKVINQKVLLQLNDNSGLDNRLQDLQNELAEIQKAEAAIEIKLKKLIKKELDLRIPKKVYDEIFQEITTESRQISDNKLVCLSNIKMLAKQSGEKKIIESELSKGLSIFNNSKEEIDSIYPPQNRANELAARKYVKDFISEVKVTYSSKSKKYDVEITFNKVGIKNDFDDKEPYRFDEVPKKIIEVGLTANADLIKLQLPVVSNQYFLNDNPEFRLAYETKQMESMKSSNNKGSKQLPPLLVQRHR